MKNIFEYLDIKDNRSLFEKISLFHLKQEFYSAWREGKKVAHRVLIRISRKIANFLYKNSSETAFVMLIFNAISNYSSHTEHINGLENSNRVNKKFLIEQEKKEREIDLFLSTVPPFFVKKFFSKQFSSGALITKDTERKMARILAPELGASVEHDLYKIDKSTKKQLFRDKFIAFIDLLLPDKASVPPKYMEPWITVKTYRNRLNYKNFRMGNMTWNTLSYRLDDIIRTGVVNHHSKWRRDMRNGKAYFEFGGQKNGLEIDANILYTIVANNILMPMWKNISTNRQYEYDLDKMGKTKDDMRQKERFSVMQYTLNDKYSHLFHHMKI